MLEIRKVSLPVTSKFYTLVKLLQFVFFDFLDKNAMLLFSFLTTPSFIPSAILPDKLFNKSNKVFNIKMSDTAILLKP